MSKSDFMIRPIAEDCVEVSFGNIVSPELNDRVLALYRDLSDPSLKWITESVPAYSSLAVYFDPCKLGGSGSAIETVSMALARIASNGRSHQESPADARTVEIPARFGGVEGPDLDEVANTNGLSPDEVVRTFLSREYRVYMLGFLPGFAYMGILDPRIATPRQAAPRTKVPAGSIGIAENQTGIYPFDSPGGWQIIGKTDIRLFDTDPERLSLLRAGDNVKFLDAG